VQRAKGGPARAEDLFSPRLSPENESSESGFSYEFSRRAMVDRIVLAI